MLLLDRQSGATTQPRGEAQVSGVSASRVQLRLRADGRLLDLLPGKTTIGSSPRCNVRIEQPGVQPLHCLIIEGPEGLRVRSWVANTQLNGMPFEESPLRAGDCLCLGVVELDVVDPQAEKKQLGQVESRVAESKDSEEIRAGRERARARRRQLLDTLRRERTSHRELCQQVLKRQESHLDAIAEQNEISSKLESCLADLAAARQQLGELANVEAARQALATRNEQLGFEIGELSSQINELTNRQSETVQYRQQLADEHAAVQQNLEQLTEQHLQLRDEFGRVANEKNALREQHRQLSEANAQFQIDVGQLANEKAAAEEHCRLLADQKLQLESKLAQQAGDSSPLAEQLQLVREANSKLQSDADQLAQEKAAVDERNRQLEESKLQLTSEVGQLTEQVAEIEAEREALRRYNEQLLGETRTLAGQKGLLTDERTSLCQERNELRQQNEALRIRVSQLNEENSAMAVGKLTLAEHRDALSYELDELRARAAKLDEENATLAAAKATQTDDLARLVADQKRLAELEREMGAAVADRESASAELYRALLQLAELQESDGQNKAIVEAYEALSKEHDQLHEKADQLREQVQQLTGERTAVEGAWQALSDEATTLSESQQSLADDNAKLRASLDETRQQLEMAQREQDALAEAASELERERAAKLQAEADVAAAIADGERRLAEQERRFAALSLQTAENSNETDDRALQYAEQSRQLEEAMSSLEQQLASASETRDSLARAHEESQLRLADAEASLLEQSRRIGELELQLTAVEEREAKLAELAERQPVVQEEPATFTWSSALVKSASHEPTLEPAVSEEKTANTSFAPLAAPVEQEIQAESKPAAKPEPTSFIERYSHLLAEDGAAEEVKPARPIEFTPARPVASSGGRSQVAELQPNTTEDEDSIEQYMAKLLQRVRGDSPIVTASAEQPSEMPLSAPPAMSTARPLGNSAALAMELSEGNVTGEANSDDAQQATIVEPVTVRRRVSAPVPKTDMGALRALANETARNAIGRHELQKHRKNAVTKVIVASLAGMTSLWLMLDSPDWRHVQFITACVALLVAVYWAVESFRTILRSRRISVYEGREAAALEGILVEVPALPIDVEASGRR